MALFRSQGGRPGVPEPALNLSREILDRIERVHDYHDASKHTYDAVQAAVA